MYDLLFKYTGLLWQEMLFYVYLCYFMSLVQTDQKLQALRFYHNSSDLLHDEINFSPVGLHGALVD